MTRTTKRITAAAALAAALALPSVASAQWGPPVYAPPPVYVPPPVYSPPIYAPPVYVPRPQPRCYVSERWVWMRDAWGRPYRQLVPREVCRW